MTTCVGIKKDQKFKAVLTIFTQLAFRYNNYDRIIVFSDLLTEYDYKQLIFTTKFNSIDKLTTKEYQNFTWSYKTDLHEVCNILSDMCRTGCEPNVCVLYFSEQAIKREAQSRSVYYDRLYSLIIDKFPNIDFIITIDEEYMQGKLRML